MSIKKHIPNIVTLGNLFCGTLATIFAVGGHFEMTALFVALGIFLDFFDGFFARIFNVSGELGKQLDSLADMVTSGDFKYHDFLSIFAKLITKKILCLSLNPNSHLLFY